MPVWMFRRRRKHSRAFHPNIRPGWAGHSVGKLRNSAESGELSRSMKTHPTRLGPAINSQQTSGEDASRASNNRQRQSSASYSRYNEGISGLPTSTGMVLLHHQTDPSPNPVQYMDICMHTLFLPAVYTSDNNLHCRGGEHVRVLYLPFRSTWLPVYGHSAIEICALPCDWSAA